MPAKLNLAGQRFGLAENHEAEPMRRGKAPQERLLPPEFGPVSVTPRKISRHFAASMDLKFDARSFSRSIFRDFALARKNHTRQKAAS